ncbi:hypothetical protein [Embleya hyalina]|uniref:Uncharacterized protein n=1 Tax=Embleya hyalina TaxID=516124 RepID=A0A401YEJ3_9ACTN|nr:hypothetical protein [Embleya hyalina]GCD93010.1 hypothetical protein EHYA_00653 [Embleya hyalina]
MTTVRDYKELCGGIAAHHRERLDAVFAGEAEPGAPTAPDWAKPLDHVPPDELPSNLGPATDAYGRCGMRALEGRREDVARILREFRERRITQECAEEWNRESATVRRREQQQGDDEYFEEIVRAIDAAGDDEDVIARIVEICDAAFDALVGAWAVVGECLRDWLTTPVERIDACFERAIGIEPEARAPGPDTDRPPLPVGHPAGREAPP